MLRTLFNRRAGKKLAVSKFLLKKQKSIKKQMAEYLEWCEFIKLMTRATMVTKRKAIDRFMFVNPDLEDLRHLTNEQFDVWRADLAREGKAGKTINNYADHIIGACRYHGERKRLPLKINLKAIDRADESDTEAYYFTPEEVLRIKEKCRGLRETILISLIFDSGLRISEVANLRLDNIKQYAITIRGKGRKVRSTFVLAETREQLDSWLAINGIVEGHIFPSPIKLDAPLSIQQIRESINAPIRRAGFKKGSAHAIRHAFITKLIDGGADIFATQTLVGHSDPKTTRRYYHSNLEQLAKKHANAMSA